MILRNKMADGYYILLPVKNFCLKYNSTDSIMDQRIYIYKINKEGHKRALKVRFKKGKVRTRLLIHKKVLMQGTAVLLYYCNLYILYT